MINSGAYDMIILGIMEKIQYNTFAQHRTLTVVKRKHLLMEGKSMKFKGFIGAMMVLQCLLTPQIHVGLVISSEKIKKKALTYLYNIQYKTSLSNR